MNTSRRMLPLGTVALFSLFLMVYALAGAVSAQAAGPATVSVRVVGTGPPYQALLPFTQVTTTTTPVTKDGGSCSGTSAAGALELATRGNWEGTWSSKYSDYEVITIDGKSFPFEEGAPANYYWSFWINNKYQEKGVCEAELEPGDQVLFVPSCYGTSCPIAPNVLGIEVPATVEVKKPVTVTVLSYPNAGGPPEPAQGVTVEGGGDSNAPPTNAQGQTTLVFAGDGSYTINAIGAAEPPTIPAEAFVCAHEGNDGTCGTTAPGNSLIVKSSPGSSGTTVNSGPPVIETAKIAGMKNGHVYPRRRAPRLLKGSVVVPAGGLLQKVQISLKRRYHGRCYDFDGATVRFVAIKCKRTASFFSVGTEASFSYLLPERLPKGSYTYDIEAVDGAGEATKLVSGVSHVVFQVK
jgi:hypothetical protein